MRGRGHPTSDLDPQFSLLALHAPALPPLTFCPCATRLGLQAECLTSHLEPDARSELEFECCSTQPSSHPAYKHTITLSNLQARAICGGSGCGGAFK